MRAVAVAVLALVLGGLVGGRAVARPDDRLPLRPTLGVFLPADVKSGVIEKALQSHLPDLTVVVTAGSATGPCDFDAYGRALNRISHWKVTNQKVTGIDAFDCVANPATCPPI